MYTAGPFVGAAAVRKEVYAMDNYGYDPQTGQPLGPGQQYAQQQQFAQQQYAQQQYAQQQAQQQQYAQQQYAQQQAQQQQYAQQQAQQQQAQQPYEKQPAYSQQTQAYKCPACSAALQFTHEGKLHCNSCGNDYEVETIKSLYQFDQNAETFSWGDYKRNFYAHQERLNDSVVYVCRSCGATVETSPTTVATHCPYCDNEIVITDRVGSGLKPDGIIPFRIDKKGLEDIIRNTFKGKKLLPGNFMNTHKMDKLLGVYVPFWLFDVGIDGQMALNATQVRMYSDRNYNYTETRHFLLDMDGAMQFSKIPVDASERMDDDLMDSIEPFDYSQLVDFDPAYLAGFVADRFDEDPDKSLPRATKRMNVSAEQAFASAAPGSYQSVSVRSNNMRAVNPSVRYVLLPVYLLNLDYNGKKYRFAVNGQTGKIVGELPVSTGKAWLWRLGIAVVLGLVIATVLGLLGI